jgi:hypothetical protein
MEPRPAAAAGSDRGLSSVQFGPKLLTPEQEFLIFRIQGCGNDDVAMTGVANHGAPVVLPGAERTDGGAGHGAIFKVKTELLIRPSESAISTRKLCSPVGTSASGMSIPAGWANRATRGVISTSGILK